MLSSAGYGNVKVGNFRQNCLNWELPVLMLGCGAKLCGFIAMIQDPSWMVYKSVFSLATIKLLERTIKGKKDLLRSTVLEVSVHGCLVASSWAEHHEDRNKRHGRSSLLHGRQEPERGNRKESGTCYPQSPLMSPVTNLHH